MSRSEAAGRRQGQTKIHSPNRVVFEKLASFTSALLFDRRYYWHTAALVLVGQLALGILVIRYVKYTEIDWTAYMEQVDMFKAGERDYSKIRGGTGPLVYPALHLYIYSLLHDFLPATPSEAIRAAQYFYLGVWSITYIEVAGIIYLAGQGTTCRLPQVLLLMLVLSKRNLSIYLLRLFNDPLAAAVVYAAILLFMGAQRSAANRARFLWRTGSVLFSFALGIKMNILLLLPGLLVLLVQLRGVAGTAESIAIIGLIQVLLPAPFFLSSTSHARAYFVSAFDFSRQFLYVWTVNWRLVPEKVFLSKPFGVGLLFTQLALLILFALFKWSPSRYGGSVGVVKKVLTGGPRACFEAPVSSRHVPAYHVPLVLFTSNLIGVTCARSLHYQFYAWYFHQLPLLTGLAFASKNLWATLLIAAAQFLTIEYAWNQYPSTVMSSFLLVFSHLNLLRGIWRIPEAPEAQTPKHVD